MQINILYCIKIEQQNFSNRAAGIKSEFYAHLVYRFKRVLGKKNLNSSRRQLPNIGIKILKGISIESKENTNTTENS